ncbi:Uncharacterised protein [Yersinia enterocolitica]|nr:Uncharacterised protein [Yersinia enterocolitica]
MSRFKQCALITNVSTWGNTDTANLSSQCIRNVIPIQVHTRDNIIFSRTQQDLLQESIGNHIFNNDILTVVWILDFNPRAAIDQLTTKFLTR